MPRPCALAIIKTFHLFIYLLNLLKTPGNGTSAMRKSPVTIQEWLDTLPSPKQPPEGASSPMHGPRPSLRLLGRDTSFQSDDCSHCSSVESVLELRKPDPEAVLLGLGFGPPTTGQNVSRIPSRFLQPSKLLTKIDINKFLEGQGEQQTEFTSNPSSPARVKSNMNWN